MKMTDKLLYWLLLALMYPMALLPLRVLYLFSDFLYLFVYHVVGYRKKVVRENLNLSFSAMSIEQKRTLERNFYHHFCDYAVETVKLLHISDGEMKRRLVFENIEVLENAIAECGSGYLFLGHFGNWEWVPSITMHVDKSINLGQIYRPLRNKAVDAIFLKIRSRFGSTSIAKEDTFREIVRRKRAGIPSLIGFMADQTPSVRNIHYWTQFLNQDTPVFTGVERIAQKVGGYVLYLDVRKVRRGYYSCRFQEITLRPQEESEMAITECYIRMIEKTILRQPAFWLWTHKRWKFKRKTE